MIRRIVIHDDLWDLLKQLAKGTTMTPSMMARVILHDATHDRFIKMTEDRKRLWKARAESPSYTPLPGQVSIPYSSPSEAISRQDTRSRSTLVREETESN